MSFFLPVTRNRVSSFITFLPFFLVLIVSTSAFAQKRVSREFQVPTRSSLDLETRSGQITVSNVQGDLLRAHVSTSGDITLSGINAARVFASNTTGNIYFDGDFASGGTYEFRSGRGTITLRLPANCGFHLVATAPAEKTRATSTSSAASPGGNYPINLVLSSIDASL